ncbi:hypothetical protein SPRG_08642 [Saprolegnia parasitica CBS 223.65]|uniref:Uncharacterized protein n=1 Tax=Saprolegnia parasitica (strain CBS 223.65) TaxID=695850 RepID=A0A067C5C7_SAPPC|nr:hypothetical protein SPRG_08642 [Saprolegnia parasitica CBS 223.65]KDO25989.1 hypothetical protein SPRG_08642 [Saprolegnia parasitica CBS 223.65]|eukprot:XP_012203276.1 hypothetical protein SPRG_08642 [Saprolegnia parasitica CBS 223.65]
MANISRSMSEAEEICGGIACAAFCGICCVAAAEEDKREREASFAQKNQAPVGPITPVAVTTLPPSTLGKATLLPIEATGKKTPTKKKKKTGTTETKPRYV